MTKILLEMSFEERDAIEQAISFYIDESINHPEEVDPYELDRLEVLSDIYNRINLRNDAQDIRYQWYPHLRG